LRGAPLLAVLVPATGCGGESRRLEPAPSDAAAVASATPTPTPVLPDCGSAATDLDAGAPSAGRCPSLLLDVDPRAHDTCRSDGVTVEPLQLPDSFDFDALEPQTGPFPDQNPDPATWDRSALPAGACVFRLHGVDASCYPLGGTFFTGSCAGQVEGRQIEPYSFYEAYSYCTSGPAPGCPSADPRVGEPGNWWYFVDQGDAADLVICAPECWNSFALSGGCLRLNPTALPTCR